MLRVPERAPDTGSDPRSPTLPPHVAVERYRLSTEDAWAHAIRLVIEVSRLKAEIALLQAELDRRAV